MSISACHGWKSSPSLLKIARCCSVFEPRLKIGGFGFSKSAAMDSMAKTAVGTRGYMAPEVSHSQHQLAMAVSLP